MSHEKAHKAIALHWDLDICLTVYGCISMTFIGWVIYEAASPLRSSRSPRMNDHHLLTYNNLHKSQ